MELALSLGDTPKPFSFLEKSQKILGKDLGFCMAAGKASHDGERNHRSDENRFSDGPTRASSSDPPVQLDLLPFSPVQRNLQPSPTKFPFPWLTEKLGGDSTSRKGGGGGGGDEGDQEGASLSSPNSAASSFQMDFSMFRSARGKRDFEQFAANNAEAEADRGASSRGSDEEENGLARKKLRLTKDQSAFLEDSFKEHNTLNPKQKLALAKQLNLRPRQVEVWFQNRRARTKLKQTEVDCEYLKRCCETLTEENRRLQKELQELRALKASQPFYMQLPATTLTMCPSCERVVTTTAAAAPPSAAAAPAKKGSKHFALSPPHAHAQKTAS
ncbi:homeobox leucine zipper protein [Perilla frutescens var. hirtella]|uniref:Homeobox leucine zipper protein n=1 Tax=Perilla frutescens var. hirtella TaxID=608512 RepID=A0AAD4J5A0_PERFH|nr:homeobox leucine zipper protein [Perilla frutescens var. hirtella]